MDRHTATTLAYVRTSAGVVQVDPEGTVPDGVDEAQLQRLVASGAVVKVPADDNGNSGQSRQGGRGKASRQGSPES